MLVLQSPQAESTTQQCAEQQETDVIHLSLSAKSFSSINNPSEGPPSLWGQWLCYPHLSLQFQQVPFPSADDSKENSY